MKGGQNQAQVKNTAEVHPNEDDARAGPWAIRRGTHRVPDQRGDCGAKEVHAMEREVGACRHVRELHLAVGVKHHHPATSRPAGVEARARKEQHVNGARIHADRGAAAARWDALAALKAMCRAGRTPCTAAPALAALVWRLGWVGVLLEWPILHFVSILRYCALRYLKLCFYPSLLWPSIFGRTYSADT